MHQWQNIEHLGRKKTSLETQRAKQMNNLMRIKSIYTYILEKRESIVLHYEKPYAHHFFLGVATLMLQAIIRSLTTIKIDDDANEKLYNPN